MFRFFPENKNEGEEEEDSIPEAKKQRVSLNPSHEILINDTHSKLVSDARNKGSPLDATLADGLTLKCVNLAELQASELISGNEKVRQILKSTSDLDSGVYEGGFKTWECTFDLANYLRENFDSVFKLSGEDDKRPIRVLDLGCGSGLAGLASLTLAEQRSVDIRVDFQDYNEEVLDYVTIPNTLLNFEDEKASKCRYFSGDWDNFRELIIAESSKDGRGYDLILSSETIYNLDYLPKFLRVLKTCLRQQTGRLYLAAKTFYFGVGGGTKAFLKMVAEDNSLHGSVLHVIKHGVQREIILVQHKPVSE